MGVILYFAMALYKKVVDRFQITILRSGEYGDPAQMKPWIAQLLVWGFMASGEKFITGFLVILPLHWHLDQLAVAIEAPVVRYPHIELLMVMVAAPVLLNIVFFWLIDNIIMLKRSKHDLTEDRQPLIESDFCCCPSGRRSK